MTDRDLDLDLDLDDLSLKATGKSTDQDHYVGQKHYVFGQCSGVPYDNSSNMKVPEIKNMMEETLNEKAILQSEYSSGEDCSLGKSDYDPYEMHNNMQNTKNAVVLKDGSQQRNVNSVHFPDGMACGTSMTENEKLLQAGEDEDDTGLAPRERLPHKTQGESTEPLSANYISGIRQGYVQQTEDDYKQSKTFRYQQDDAFQNDFKIDFEKQLCDEKIKYLEEHWDDGNKVNAIKYQGTKCFGKKVSPQKAEKEVTFPRMLSKCKCSVVEVIGTSDKRDKVIVWTENAGTALRDMAKEKFKTEAAKERFYQSLVKLMLQLYKNGASHNDINLGNICMKGNTFCLIDFETSFMKNYSDGNSTLTFHSKFAPPSVNKASHDGWLTAKVFFQEKADFWGISIIFYDLFSDHVFQEELRLKWPQIFKDILYNFQPYSLIKQEHIDELLKDFPINKNTLCFKCFTNNLCVDRKDWSEETNDTFANTLIPDEDEGSMTDVNTSYLNLILTLKKT